MSIEVKVVTQELPLAEPFTTAHQVAETETLLYLGLYDEEGNCGLGSGSCDTHFSKDTIPVVRDLLRKVLPSCLTSSKNDPYVFNTQIQRAFAGYPVAQAIAEEAFLNLHARQTGKTLLQVLSELASDSSVMPSLTSYTYDSCDIQDEIPIMISIGIENLNTTLAKVRQRLEEGYQVIKLKVGSDVEEDITTVRAVKKILPSGILLLLDANAEYSFTDAERLFTAIQDQQGIIVEQPLGKDDLNKMKELHERCPNIPIFADESVMDPESALTLCAGDYVSGINVKLLKCGGVINFLRMFHIARAYGKQIMLGCMYESNISVTTAITLARVLHLDLVDQDTGKSFDFPNEQVEGGAYLQSGKMCVGEPVSFTGKWDR